MPMKGRYPIRRTLEYLQKGDIIFKNKVKIMTVNYNTHGDLSDGARSELTTANKSTFPAKTLQICHSILYLTRFFITFVQRKYLVK